MELRLDRQLFFPAEWKTFFSALLALVWPKRTRTRITVGPMSDEWLHQHIGDYPKHE